MKPNRAAVTLTLASVRPLCDQFRGDGLMVSWYADLSAAPGLPAGWPGPFKAKAAAIKEMLADDPRARRQFERNFQAIGRALQAPEARRARGMAVFAALQRDFLQSFALDVAVEDELVVHEAPYLVPLLQALSRQREYLVVLTDTHRGRLYGATPGCVRLLREVEEAVPSRQHSAGERWGKEQATIARHREDRILHYQKELVELVEKAWAEHPFQGLVLLGEHEVLEHVRKRLPPRLAAQVVHEGPQAWAEKPLAIGGEIRAILADALPAQEERRLEDFKRRLREGYAVAAGPGEVIEALEKGRVGPRGHGYLVFGPDPAVLVAAEQMKPLLVLLPELAVSTSKSTISLYAGKLVVGYAYPRKKGLPRLRAYVGDTFPEWATPDPTYASWCYIDDWSTNLERVVTLFKEAPRRRADDLAAGRDAYRRRMPPPGSTAIPQAEGP
jgi:hypothetical protein